MALNAVFIALSLSSNLISQEKTTQRVRQAFASGDLIERDYLPYDRVRGWHQYNDCNILQMITNADSSALGRGMGPWLHLNSSSDEVCHSLRDIVMDGGDTAALVSSRYTRYWHGYIPIVATLLSTMNLFTVRVVLAVTVYAAVLLLLLAGLREQRLLLIAAPASVAAALFWGLPYFGQGLSHALSDATVMLGLACLVLWFDRFVRPSTLLPFCAGFGAVVVYFEMLTGSLPTAVGFLFPIVYLISRLSLGENDTRGNCFTLAALAVLAFVFGAGLTVGIRIATAATLVRPSGLEVFFGNLGLYTHSITTEGNIPAVLHPLGRLIRKGAVLTYGSSSGLLALYASSVITWLAAGWLALRSRSNFAWKDLAAFALGAAAIFGWTVILPAHTFIHAIFMTRILIVPISLGWAALLWQLSLQQAKAAPV
jgi:hypothetical protein